MKRVNVANLCFKKRNIRMFKTDESINIPKKLKKTEVSNYNYLEKEH